MLYILSFISFLVYTVLIFFLTEYYMLGIALAINIVLMIILKISFKKALFAVLKLMPFVIFTSGINIAISGLNFGILIRNPLDTCMQYNLYILYKNELSKIAIRNRNTSKTIKNHQNRLKRNRNNGMHRNNIY